MSRKPAGRPPTKTFSWDEFDRLCKLQCTLAEFACYFDVSEDTIERRVKEEKHVSFADYFEQKRQAGRTSLRRKMFRQALTEGGAMAIFLAKQPQYLNFTDQTKQTNVDDVSEDAKKLVEELKRLIKK